eukprot:768810-Hanusia_phi.AAC.15
MAPPFDNTRKKVEEWIENSKIYEDRVVQRSHPPAIQTDITSYLEDFGGILKSAFDWTIQSVDDTRADASLPGSENASVEDKPSPVASKPHLKNGNIAIFSPQNKHHKISKANTLTSEFPLKLCFGKDWDVSCILALFIFPSDEQSYWTAHIVILITLSAFRGLQGKFSSLMAHGPVTSPHSVWRLIVLLGQLRLPQCIKFHSTKKNVIGTSSRLAPMRGKKAASPQNGREEIEIDSAGVYEDHAGNGTQRSILPLPSEPTLSNGADHQEEEGNGFEDEVPSKSMNGKQQKEVVRRLGHAVPNVIMESNRRRKRRRRVKTTTTILRRSSQRSPDMQHGDVMCFPNSSIPKAFNQVDTEGEGLILAEQLGMVLEILGIVVGQEELEELIADMTDDLDGGTAGTILLDDFVEVMIARHKGQELSDEELKEAFSVFDVDDVGFADQGTLEQAAALLTCNFHRQPEEIDEMFKATTRDPQGRVTYEEFRDIIRWRPPTMKLAASETCFERC